MSGGRTARVNEWNNMEIDVYMSLQSMWKEEMQ